MKKLGKNHLRLLMIAGFVPITLAASMAFAMGSRSSTIDGHKENSTGESGRTPGSSATGADADTSRAAILDQDSKTSSRTNPMDGDTGALGNTPAPATEKGR